MNHTPHHTTPHYSLVLTVIMLCNTKISSDLSVVPESVTKDRLNLHQLDITRHFSEAQHVLRDRDLPAVSEPPAGGECGGV